MVRGVIIIIFWSRREWGKDMNGNRKHIRRCLMMFRNGMHVTEPEWSAGWHDEHVSDSCRFSILPLLLFVSQSACRQVVLFPLYLPHHVMIHSIPYFWITTATLSQSFPAVHSSFAFRFYKLHKRNICLPAQCMLSNVSLSPLPDAAALSSMHVPASSAFASC